MMMIRGRFWLQRGSVSFGGDLGERGEDLSGFFRLDRDVMMSWVLMPVLHQGAFMEGDESPQSD